MSSEAAKSTATEAYPCGTPQGVVDEANEGDRHLASGLGDCLILRQTYVFYGRPAS